MKHTILSLKSLAITAAGCALLGISATAFASPIILNPQPFTVEEGAIPGVVGSSQFTADAFKGGYDEIFTADNATSFTAKTIFEFGSFMLGGSTASNSLNYSGSEGYQLYALLNSSGNYSTSGGETTFSGTSNQIEIWADPLSDTDSNLPTTDAHGNYVLANNSDDIKLAYSSTGEGEGVLNSSSPQLDQGNFGLFFTDFTLTDDPLNSADGKGYFIAPVPFYINLQTTGNFDSFAPSPGATNLLTGAASGYFASVPGPGSLGLAMLGLALLGLGFITKRSQSAKGA